MQQGCCQGVHAHLCETARESYSALTLANSSKNYMQSPHGSAYRLTDKRLGIPVSPLMMGDLVPPEPNDTPTMMFQGFTETGQSSVNSCGQQGVTGSVWHCICQLTSSVVGLSAQQIWGFVNTRWSNRIFASLQIILLPLCVYADLIPCIHWCCPLFTQIRLFLDPQNEGESHVLLSSPKDLCINCNSRQ